MGFRGVDSWSTGKLWDIQSSYNVSLSEVSCSPNAVSFNECVYSTEDDNSSCDHDQDVFLSCISNRGKLNMNLVKTNSYVVFLKN